MKTVEELLELELEDIYKKNKNLPRLTKEEKEHWITSQLGGYFYSPPSWSTYQFKKQSEEQFGVKEFVIEPMFRKPEIVVKGWGTEEVLANNEEYCGKLLKFNKGADFSTHYHLLKKESFYVLIGQLLIKYFDLTNANEKEQILNEGDIVDIPRGCPHKITAITDAVIVEISTTHRTFDNYRVEKGSTQR